MPTYGKTELPKLFETTSVISVFRSNSDLSNLENVIEILPFHEFVYVEKGTINLLVDNEFFYLSPGSLIFYPPNTFRSIVTSRDAVLDIVCFECTSSLLADFPGHIIKPDKQQQQKLSEIIDLGAELLIPAPFGKYSGGMVAKENASSMMLQKLGSLIDLFLIDLYETVSNPTITSTDSPRTFDDSFVFLTEYLKQHISENIPLSDMCKVCRTSVSGLHRLCKKQCGLSPTALFISLKMAKARQLISETDLNFSEISDSLGFSSIHYFSKLFKSKTGMTPSEYAKVRHEK